MTSWKVFVAQLLTIIAGKSQTRKWALDKGVGLDDAVVQLRHIVGWIIGPIDVAPLSD